MSIYACSVHKLSENCFEIKCVALFTACPWMSGLKFSLEPKAERERERESSLTLDPSSVLIPSRLTNQI